MNTKKLKCAFKSTALQLLNAEELEISKCFRCPRSQKIHSVFQRVDLTAHCSSKKVLKIQEISHIKNLDTIEDIQSKSNDVISI